MIQLLFLMLFLKSGLCPASSTGKYRRVKSKMKRSGKRLSSIPNAYIGVTGTIESNKDATKKVIKHLTSVLQRRIYDSSQLHEIYERIDNLTSTMLKDFLEVMRCRALGPTGLHRRSEIMNANTDNEANFIKSFTLHLYFENHISCGPVPFMEDHDAIHATKSIKLAQDVNGDVYLDSNSHCSLQITKNFIIPLETTLKIDPSQSIDYDTLANDMLSKFLDDFACFEADVLRKLLAQEFVKIYYEHKKLIDEI